MGQSGADYAKQWIAETILLAVIVLGVRYVMRFNIFGCFLVVGVISLASGAAELLGEPIAFYRLNGYAVVAALVLLLAWPLMNWRMRAAWTTATTQPESEIGGKHRVQATSATITNI